MTMSSSQKELIWYIGILIAFLCLLMINGIPEYFEIVIAIAAFTISWGIVSYSVKRFGAGGMDKDSIQKELMWFGGVLLAFLVLLTIVSLEDGGLSISVYAIVIAVYTIIWVIRSYAVKRFATREAKQK